MKSIWLLRVASLLALLHGLLHTMGGVFGKPASGAQTVAVTAMQANRFDAMGVVRSYWDFHMGYGLSLTVKFLVETIIFWQMASLLKAGVSLRPLLLTFGIGYIAYAALAWRYFFAAPAIFELVIAACLLGAWFFAQQPQMV
jgi:hypothetical protein